VSPTERGLRRLCLHSRRLSSHAIRVYVADLIASHTRARGEVPETVEKLTRLGAKRIERCRRELVQSGLVAAPEVEPLLPFGGASLDGSLEGQLRRLGPYDPFWLEAAERAPYALEDYEAFALARFWLPRMAERGHTDLKRTMRNWIERSTPEERRRAMEWADAHEWDG
jgi:hypothetical protein